MKLTLQIQLLPDKQQADQLKSTMERFGGAYSRDKSLLPVFRPNAAMPYDSRILPFKGVDRVSILTLEGRIIVPFVMGKYQRERFGLAKGECDLVRRKDGKWFLLVSVEAPEGTQIAPTEFIGVDFGVVNLATDNDGDVYTSTETEKARQKQNFDRETGEPLPERKLPRPSKQEMNRAANSNQ